jgi:hypothetical protein
VSRTSEVHFLGQNDYRMEMTHFDTGEHSSNPLDLQHRLAAAVRYLPYTSEGARDLKKVLKRNFPMTLVFQDS